MSQVRLVDLMHAPADMVNQMREWVDPQPCHAMLVGKGRTCGKGQKHTVKK
jgi:hypothetical protein